MCARKAKGRPEVRWAWAAPGGRSIRAIRRGEPTSGFVTARTKSEARRLVADAIGLPKSRRLPDGFTLQAVAELRPISGVGLEGNLEVEKGGKNEAPKMAPKGCSERDSGVDFG